MTSMTREFLKIPKLEGASVSVTYQLKDPDALVALAHSLGATAGYAWVHDQPYAYIDEQPRRRAADDSTTFLTTLRWGRWHEIEFTASVRSEKSLLEGFPPSDHEAELPF